MMKTGTRILIVEDDRSITEFLVMELEHEGMRVLCVHDGPSALEMLDDFRPEIVVLDIMLPGLDGVGVLKRIRERGEKLPVIMLTARDSTQDKVHSLDYGADDYLTKPFEVEELLARMRALMRRVEGEEVLRVGDLEINRSTREVRRGERKVELTAREYELLEFMAQNPRRVLSRESILEEVWEDAGLGTKVVDVYVGYLRRKLEGAGEGALIRTIRGAGYALRKD